MSKKLIITVHVNEYMSRDINKTCHSRRMKLPGIGDYLYPKMGCPTNVVLVRQFAELGCEIRRGPASTDKACKMLGIASN